MMQIIKILFFQFDEFCKLKNAMNAIEEDRKINNESRILHRINNRFICCFSIIRFFPFLLVTDVQAKLLFHHIERQFFLLG